MHGIRLGWIAWIGTALLAACGTAKLAVPDDVAATPRLPVTGRLGWMNTQSVKFGGYVTESVDRTWTRGGGFAIGRYERNRRKQSYAFGIRGPDTHPVRVECSANLLMRGINTNGATISLDDRSTLDCDIIPDSMSAGGPWTLALQDDGKHPLSGRLTRGSDTIVVTGTNKVAGGALPATITTGYHLERNGRAVASVEVMNNGAVWLNTQDPRERALLAATATALLLAEDLRVSVPDN